MSPRTKDEHEAMPMDQAASPPGPAHLSRAGVPLALVVPGLASAHTSSDAPTVIRMRCLATPRGISLSIASLGSSATPRPTADRTPPTRAERDARIIIYNARPIAIRKIAAVELGGVARGTG